MIAGVLTASELALLRTRPQRTLLYLAIPAYNTVYTARLNVAPASNDKVFSINFDGGAGTLANVVSGMMLLVGTSAGAWDVGIARIRDDSLDLGGGAGTLFIGITSEIEWVDNQYLTIVDDFSLWPRHPFVSAIATYMDYGIAYTNQNVYGDPVPIMGSHAVLELTGATVTVNFDASDSYTCIGAPDHYDYAWYVDGVLVSNADNVDISFAAVGTYLVKLKIVADYDIGSPVIEKTSIAYRYVIVHDCEHPLNSSFALDSCDGDFESGGWSYRVTMNANAAEANVRDRTLCLLVAKDWYGDTQQSIGPLSGRENIICSGWVDGESVRRSNDKSMVSFEVQGPSFWLGVQEGFPTGIDDTNVAPTDWNHINTLTPRKGLFSFLHWRTTATMVTDCWITSDDHRLATTYTPAGSLLEQLRAIAERVNARTVCDRYGRLFCEIDTQFITPVSRTFPVVQTLSDRDWRDEIGIERSDVAKVGQVDLSGIFYSGSLATSNAIFSLSPGHIPKHYGDKRKVERIALDDQAEANLLAGLWLGYFNNEYPNVDTPMSSNYRAVDIAPRMFAQMNLAAGDTPRGITWTNKKLIPRRVSFRYDAGEALLLTDITFESEAFPSDAIVGDPPLEPPDPPNPPAPPTLCNDPDAINFGGIAPCIYPPSVNVVIVLTQSQLGRTENFDDASPNWIDISGAITGILYNIKVSGIEGWVSADSGIWHTNDVTDSPVSWSCVMSQAALLAASGLGAYPNIRFKCLDVSGSTAYTVPQYGSVPEAWGYFEGDSGGLTWNPWPQPPHYLVDTDGAHHIDAHTGGLYIGCGTGGGGGATVYNGGSFISYPAEFGNIDAVSGGFALAHTYHLYGPGWAVALYDATHRNPYFGLDTIGGGMPLATGGAAMRYLYRDHTEIAYSVDVFGNTLSGPIGGRAIYRSGGADSIIWVSMTPDPGGPDRHIVSTGDGFSTYDDRTGDWVATIGAWAGASGSGGVDGNALAIEVIL